MVDSYQSLRGMNDVLPVEAPYWQLLENACRRLAEQYGYHEIRFPILENTALFKRTVGEATDIVEKEMFTFDDRSGESVSLRPEGTAGCVRAGVQHGLLYNQVQRLWYIGPMYRHERPQKGRYRQFFQFGVEAFGMQGPDIDVEQLLMFKRLLQAVGLLEHVQLEINTLGSMDERAQYRNVLVEYLKQYESELDEDSQRRLSTNPLRILDSKNPQMQTIINNAPKLMDHIGEASKAHFDGLRSLLEKFDISYIINPRLVRGLDYYGLTVYEWTTKLLGAQGTVCAGGHYDSLVEQLGGKATPAVGFAMGFERLVLLLKETKVMECALHACMVLTGELAMAKGMEIAEQLRTELPGLRIVCNLSAGGFKSQFRRADKSGARYALILGDDEVAANHVAVKDLRAKSPQQNLSFEDVKAVLAQLFM